MTCTKKTARSLRSRMLLAGGATIVLCWGVALAVLSSYFALSQSSIEDKRLRGIAHKLLQTIPVHKNLRGVEQDDTPWIGGFERINAYATFAWLIALAIKVNRHELGRTRAPGRVARFLLRGKPA